MKSDLNNLLTKEMDRTDFLKHVGIALVALTGASAIIKALTNIGSQGSVSNSFGSGTYGGNRTRGASR